MLHLYQSHRIETLADLLVAVLGVPPADPLAPETVIVQAKGMGRWLTLRLAQHFGVCANVQFPLPASFMWQLVETVLGPQERLGDFSRDALAWRLEDLLRRQPPAGLSGYLADGLPHKRWRLAARIADAFDQYLVYRPDWLASWEAGTLAGLGADETWQAALWQSLCTRRGGVHRADLLDSLLRRLHSTAPLDLPERLVVFGISSLPPKVLEVLVALARRIDVCFFALNPCREAWGDVLRQAPGGASMRDADAEFDPDIAPNAAFCPGERLLAAWGGQGRSFFDALLAHEPTLLSDTGPDDVPLLTLLQTLQQDILTLAPLQAERPWPAQDDSLRIHTCHSPMRQVEALKDALLARLQADPTLHPADMAVLCPDIEAFVPYIDAVFAPQSGEPTLPYAVADRTALVQSPLLAACLNLLRWPESDWAADVVLALLETPALARRAGFAEDDLPLLRGWVEGANIRRGLDTDAYGWQAGLSRLMLGVLAPAWGLAGTGALGDEGRLPLFQGCAPLAEVDLSQRDKIAALRGFIRALDSFARSLQPARPLAQWAGDIAAALASLLDADDADTRALAPLHEALAVLAQLAATARLEGPVERLAVVEWLADRLESPSGAGGFLTGGVTFAQLVPMRNLPFRVIAVLGLEDGQFPRNPPADAFDLIARHPRSGDRARRLDERWLFLETLLAAREALWLFYSGRDQRSDSARPPSTVVADLQDVIRRGWPAATGQDPLARLTVQHPLQPFSAQRFGPDAPPSFASHWARLAGQIGRGTAAAPPFTAEPIALPLPDPVPLDELIHFAGDPCGWLLRRLAVYFDRAETAVENREPFAVNEATRRQLAQTLGLNADAPALLAAWGQGTGLLPTGTLGTAWADALADQMHPALAQWRSLGQGADQVLPVALELAAHGRRGSITGLLAGIGPQGRVLLEPGKLSMPGQIRAWLQHLVLCAQHPAGIALTSTLIGLDDTLRFEAVANAPALLAVWLAAYAAAHRQLPPYLPRSSHAWASAQHKGHDDPLQAARLVWEGNERSLGEGDYEAVRAVWRGHAPLDEGFEDWAARLLLPMVQANKNAA